MASRRSRNAGAGGQAGTSELRLLSLSNVVSRVVQALGPQGRGVSWWPE